MAAAADAPDPMAEPAPHPYHGKRRTRAGGRVNFLFFAPLPLAVSAFFQSPTGMVRDLAAFGLIVLAAWLTREGLKAEDAYVARTRARRPAMPRKIFGAGFMGTGLAVAGLPAASVADPAIFAALGAGLHLLAFGLDPLRDKGPGSQALQTERVARVVDEAESHIAAMRAAIHQSGARDLEARVDRFAEAARAMCRAVEEDPRDLAAARKYLGVYLLGAREATEKFRDLALRRGASGARASYEALLTDLERNFAAQTDRLLAGDRDELELDIEVLRERLEREGVAAAETQS